MPADSGVPDAVVSVDTATPAEAVNAEIVPPDAEEQPYYVISSGDDPEPLAGGSSDVAAEADVPGAQAAEPVDQPAQEPQAEAAVADAEPGQPEPAPEAAASEAAAAETTTADAAPAEQGASGEFVPMSAEDMAAQVALGDEAAASQPTEEFSAVEQPGSDMPDDLREISDLLDRPTAEIMPISADDIAAANAEGATPAQGEELAAQVAAAAAEGAAAVEAATAEGAADESATEAEPATATAAEQLPEPEADATISKVSWWPFLGYMVVWLVAAGLMVWQLKELPATQVAYESELYTQATFGALVLLAVGPVLLLIVWLASWIGRANARVGSMFISALAKGSSATLFGALVWLGALLLTDYYRLGRPF